MKPQVRIPALVQCRPLGEAPHPCPAEQRGLRPRSHHALLAPGLQKARVFMLSPATGEGARESVRPTTPSHSYETGTDLGAPGGWEGPGRDLVLWVPPQEAQKGSS